MAAETYRRLSAEQEKPAPELRDHSAAWERLEPIATLNGTLRERIESFAASKHITLAALEALDTRIDVRGKGPEIRLAWASTTLIGERRVVTALKYRNIATGERQALKPSVFVRPLIIGNTGSLDVFVAEGESDGARLYDLVGDVATVLVAPAGALTWKRAWENWLLRGATVHLCHDADAAGDEGAAKAAKLISGHTVRVRPPVEGGDWCDWPGERREFVQIVAAARAEAQTAGIEPLDLDDLLAGPVPETSWLWRGWLARGDLALVVADPKVGKSLTALGLAAATRLGLPFLGDRCERGRVGVFDYENPLEEVQKRLHAFGIGPHDHEGIVYFHMPLLDLATMEAAQLLEDLIRRHELDLVVLDSVRRAAPGLDENDSQSVSSVFSPLRRVSALTGATVLAVHHARKRIGDNPTEAGQMVRGSGDLVASVDTLLYLRAKEAGSFTLEHAATRRGLPHEPILVRIDADDERLELVNEGPVAMADDKVEALLARIIEVLHENGGALERAVIALRVDADPRNSTFARALNLGWQRNQLARSEKKVGEPTVYSLVGDGAK
jgi:hypothetical protein